MPSLVIKKPVGPEQQLPLAADGYSIGRAADNDIVLDGTMISRRHARISRDGGSFVIADLSSHNGILINGQKVEKATLEDHDQIQIGNYMLIYSQADVMSTETGPVDTVTVEEDYEGVVAGLTSYGTLKPVQAPDPAALLKQMEKERRTLALLCELSRALSALFTLDSVSRKAIQILLETTKAERGAIFLLQPDQTLLPTTVCDRDGGGAGPDAAPVSISSTVSQRILTERKGIITADAAVDPRFAHGQSVVLRGLRSIACAPLVGQAGNLGILYLENNRSIGAFTHDDLELLCAVASQVGLSVENAKFYEELKSANEELERKVEERTAALRQTEMKLYQTEKMASLSRLVAGVAHEVNNPLGALKGNMEVMMVMSGRLATAEDRPERERKLLDQMVRMTQESVNACTRIITVMRSLKSFARLDESEFKMANINEGLAAAAKLLDPEMRRRVEVSLSLGELPAIPCYPALLNEAFMNLLTNSCQSIPQTGRVSVETRRDGEEVVVQIRDTGAGMSPEHLDRIFDAKFVTTQGGRVGAGLGLPIAFSVIQQHRGTIRVTSEIGEGSMYIVRLPVAFELPVAGG